MLMITPRFALVGVLLLVCVLFFRLYGQLAHSQQPVLQPANCPGKGKERVTGDIHRFDVVNASAWAQVESKSVDSAEDTLVCAQWKVDKRFVNETSVVYAYVVGEGVFGAVHVWWLNNRACILRSAVLGEPEDTLHVLFVLAYDNGQQSLEIGTTNKTIDLSKEITHARERAVYNVVMVRGGGRSMATGGSSNRNFPWGAWRPMQPKPPVSVLDSQCIMNAACNGTRFGFFTSGVLGNLPLPGYDWIWQPSKEPVRQKVLNETCLQHHSLHLIGDSLYNQLSSTMYNYRTYPVYSRPEEGRCSARVFPPSSSVSRSSYHRFESLQTTRELSQFIQTSKELLANSTKTAPQGTRNVLLFNTGLHNLLGVNSVPKLEEYLHKLLSYLQNNQTGYDRIILTTTTQLHVFQKILGIPQKTRLTSTRTKAINQLFERVLATGLYPHVELLDLSQPTITAPWAVRDNDSVHYCRPVTQEILTLVWEHLCSH